MSAMELEVLAVVVCSAIALIADTVWMAESNALKKFLDFQKANQPSLGAEARAWLREGREDLLNNLLKAFPDSMQLSREMGAPGSPTPQQTTAALTGRDLYGKDAGSAAAGKDDKQLDKAEAQPPQQQQEKQRDMDMDT